MPVAAVPAANEAPSFVLLMLLGGSLLLAAVFAGKLSSRIGIPSLLAFIGIGMLAGSEGPGGIPFTNAELAQNIGIIALSFILFSGGVDTPWDHIRSVLPRAGAMATVGVAVTASVVAVALHFVAHFSWAESFLVGSIVSATDAAAVFSILRGPAGAVREDAGALLEAESGANDPMAIFLTIAMTRYLTEPNLSLVGLIPSFFIEMAIGGFGGFLIGRVAVLLVKRLHLAVDELYPVVTIAMALIAYALPASIHGNGFLSVYIAGVVFGNSHLRQRRGIGRFHNALSWLVQIAMFLVLGLLVFPSHLRPVLAVGTFVALVLMFAARPIATAITLAPFRPEPRLVGLVSWAGLRGAVPIILATYPLLAGVKKSDVIFNIVFFVILFSSLVQGTTLPWVARKLGMVAKPADSCAVALAEDASKGPSAEMIEARAMISDR